MNQGQATNRWYVLILSTLTLLFCSGMTTMAMPVLFKEIAEDLQLSLVQIGMIWSAFPFAAIIMGFISGVFIDRYGVKRVTIMASLLAGILGASRGLASAFWTLAISSLLAGFVVETYPILMSRAGTVWFSGRQLGLAQGVLSTGVGVGFALGALVSASTLSPVFGSWRYVLLLYGAVAVLFGLLWLFTVKEPGTFISAGSEDRLPFRQIVSRAVRIRGIWPIGFAAFGFWGCVYSVMGYLPIYLSSVGWSAIHADEALAVLNIAGAVGAIPLTLLSDKLGLRKAVILPSFILTCIGAALLTVFDNAIVWLLVVLVGFTRDATMALLITMNQEKVSGSEYAGAALGMQIAITRSGNVILPPLGNSLAGISARAPFALWTAFAIAGTVLLMFVKETGWRSKKAITGPGYDSGAL